MTLCPLPWLSRCVAVIVCISVPTVSLAQSDDSSDQDTTPPATTNSQTDKVAALTQAIQADPQNPALYRQRGYAYELEYDFTNALPDLDKAVQLDPQNPDGYRIRGFAHLEKRELDEAISDYSQTIELSPQATIAYARRAQAYELKNDSTNASDDLDQVTQLLPQGSQSVLVYLVTAGDWRRMRHYDKVLSTLNQAVTAGINDARVFNQLAWLLATCSEADLRDGKQAVQDATSACNLTRWQSPPMIDTLAAACAEAGDFDSAVKWENQALQTPAPSSAIQNDRLNRLSLYEAHQAFHLDR
jgi:tetratricopeptide (TPR) repeat protein